VGTTGWNVLNIRYITQEDNRLECPRYQVYHAGGTTGRNILDVRHITREAQQTKMCARKKYEELLDRRSTFVYTGKMIFHGVKRRFL